MIRLPRLYVKSADKRDNSHCITDPDQMHQDKRLTLLQRLGLVKANENDHGDKLIAFIQDSVFEPVVTLVLGLLWLRFVF